MQDRESQINFEALSLGEKDGALMAELCGRAVGFKC